MEPKQPKQIGKRNSYEKKFSEYDVIRVLKSFPNGLMLGKLQGEMDCSEMTLRHLLKPLVDAGQVIKTNIGTSDKKPINLYTLRK